MWRLLIFLVFLVVSVWLGLEIVAHPGYLLIVYKPWMVQMPIWFAVIGIFLGLALFYFLITSIDQVQFIWFRLKNWLQFRREHKSYSKTQRGLADLIEGRFKKAEKLLIAGISQAADPLINYLGAANAAHQQGAFDRRDEYIKKAYQVAPHADVAIGLTQAELELDQQQIEPAIAILNRLRALSPKHPRILKLLEKAYVHIGDWRHLKELLPSLRKAKVLTETEYELFEKNLYCEILNAANTKSLVEVQQIWNDLPRAMRNHPDVVHAYVKQLQRFSDTKEMEALIRKTLKHHWQPDLVTIYGTLPMNNLNRQLVIVTAWVKTYGQRPPLLLLLGKICMRLKLWGKAKDYFEKCLALGVNPDASLEYGKLLEQLDDVPGALEKYRQGLNQVVENDNEGLKTRYLEK